MDNHALIFNRARNVNQVYTNICALKHLQITTLALVRQRARSNRFGISGIGRLSDPAMYEIQQYIEGPSVPTMLSCQGA